jgi:predicted DNA binding protein
MTSEGPAESAPDDPPTSHRLYVEFELRSSSSVDCPLEAFDDEVTRINQQSLGDECHTDTTVSRVNDDQPDTEVLHTTTQMSSDCHCPVFLDFDCIPEVIDVADDHIVVKTYLPNRETLTELVEELREVTGRLALRRLVRVDAADDDRSDSVTLDLSRLTETEQATAAKAVAGGYYEDPRGITVQDLADDADVSPSAMSQRLSAIESKLALAAFSDGRGG